MRSANFFSAVSAICAGSSLLCQVMELPPSGTGACLQWRAKMWPLAKLVEAHWDAVSILAEAGRSAKEGARYAVWASEAPGRELELTSTPRGGALRGSKMFCTGAGLVDRALVTVSKPRRLMVEVDLIANHSSLHFDASNWQTEAFRETHTSTLTCDHVAVNDEDILGSENWYVDRPGFWNGACGPAACWAGGAAGLLDLALRSKRSDPHTLAHLAAISADVWAMEAALTAAGAEVDSAPLHYQQAQIRALTLRHVIEQFTVDVLTRFARAYGPYPLSMDAVSARRYQETELYVRQCHGDRDLEHLANLLRNG